MKYYKFFAIPGCTHKPLIMLKEYHMYDNTDTTPEALQARANLIGDLHIDNEAPLELPIMAMYIKKYDTTVKLYSDIKQECIQKEFDGDVKKYNQAFETYLQDYYTHSIVGYKEVDCQEYQEYQDKGSIYEALSGYEYECWYRK